MLLVRLGRFRCASGKRVIFLGLTSRFLVGDAGACFVGDFRTGVVVRRLFSLVLGDNIFGDAGRTDPVRFGVAEPVGEAFVESAPLFSLDEEPPDVTEALLRRLGRPREFCSGGDADGVATIDVRDRRIGEVLVNVAVARWAIRGDERLTIFVYIIVVKRHIYYFLAVSFQDSAILN